MATYGGFDPGTFQPWALNIAQTSMGSPGVARGLVVTPQQPATMNVAVGVDAVAGDGICWLPNGCWLRIDAALTLAVPNNTSGSPRLDAVVAFVDPTGVGGAPAVQYVTGWASGFRTTAASNQLVLALVTVPNGAASIVAANIANTAYEASIGAGSPTQLDTVVQDNGPGAQQTRLFSQYNVVVAPSAATNQTSFAVPLTARQKLVPMGRIGGGDEWGYFAGPAGWYVPRLFGSVSGPLPVKSVDHVGGNILSAAGAQAGEQVVASFKYYDFDRDLMVWAGSTLLPRSSPYIVYQGDVRPAITQLTDDLWDGTRGAYAPLTPGLAIVVTCFGRAIVPHFAPWQAGQQYSWAADGGAATTVTLAYNAAIGPAGAAALHDLSATNALDAIHQVTLTYVTGLFDFGGVDALEVGAGAYCAGGQAVVAGFPVVVGNTSLQLSPPAVGDVGVLYVTRLGATTALAQPQIAPIGEAWAGRIPLAQAVQYVAPTGNTTLYGTYALPGIPRGLVHYAHLGNQNGGTISTAGSGSTVSNSWSLVADPTSAFGCYYSTGNLANDGLLVAGVMTGVDLVCVPSTNNSVQVKVVVDNVTTATLFVPANNQGQRVRLTAATAWPAGSHGVQAYVPTAGANLGFESADLRLPELPTPPPQTLPLAGLFANGGGAAGTTGLVRKALLHDAQFAAPGAGDLQLFNDINHFSPGPVLRLGNTNVSQSWSQVVHSTGAFRVSYVCGTTYGKFNVVVDGVSTWATVDTYGLCPTTVTATVLYTMPAATAGLAHTVAVVSTNTKNPSSSGNSCYVNGIDFLPPPVLAVDETRFGPDGIRPALRGSAILGPKGDQLPETGMGIASLHLQDRAVTSRKVAPTFAKAVSTTSWSGMPGVYPSLAASVVVEVPSLLLLHYNGAVRQPATGGGYLAAQFVVDGVNLDLGAQQGYAVSDFIGTSKTNPVVMSDFAPVGPGAHTVQVFFGGGAPYGYIDNFAANQCLTVLAFAL